MFKFIMSSVASIIVLVVFSDWIFERVPGSRVAWEAIQSKVIDTYYTQGWEGVLILGVVAVGVYKMIDK
ncbi:hypothetical protein RGU76_29895 [Bacillus pseudomycoides]|uniref:hypothetical protein n=1 Tax=Bacillus pseudomycoides TaxID=64104 RepID=UPI00256FE3AC|nr:hypothetical protein [Bacillus pseudomycoides]MDR4919012.1 hypothetical protein [Bacillus pseudomycoides]WJE55431.1 hypothetical protein QRE66_27240 [Bacillus cereus]